MRHSDRRRQLSQVLGRVLSALLFVLGVLVLTVTIVTVAAGIFP
jgi:hypothetical protein